MTGPRIDQAAERGRQKVEGMFAEIRSFGARLLRPAGIVLLAEIRTRLNRRGTGRFYKSRGIVSRLGRHGSKRRATQMHRASSPGEPPAKDTGELQRSYGIDETTEWLRVGSPLPQAPALEFGTKVSSWHRQIGRTGPPQSPDRRRVLISRLRSQRRAFTTTMQGGGGGRIAPRPHVRPSFAAARTKMTAAVIDTLRIFTQRILGGA